MLSYRHAFHAGNHADVLKHLVLAETLRLLASKDKPFWVIDTHAGAGLYALDEGHATQNREFDGGIGRLWPRQDLPPAVARYVDLVRSLNPDGELRRYPGSPWFALTLSREADRIWLFERHTADCEALRRTIGARERRVRVECGDGFAGLRGLLPPAPRRGLVVIDPSYETRDDYHAVTTALEQGLERFPTGVFMVWYPCLRNRDADELPAGLLRAAGDRWLDARLSVRARAGERPGLYGSGIFMTNPPFGLADTLRATLPFLAGQLGVDGSGRFDIDGRSP